MPLWVAVFVDILGFTIILPFLAPLSRAYSTDALVIGLLLASNAIFGTIFGPIWGKLSDNHGRRPFLLVSQLGTTAGFVIMAFSNSLGMLFAARIVDGIFGGQIPISKAVISDRVAPKDRGKQMTNVGVAFTLAAVLGPGIGGLLADAFGIIGPGLAATGISIFTFAFTATRLPETHPAKTPDPPAWLVQVQAREASATRAPTISIFKNSRTLYMLALYTFLVLAAILFQTTFSIFADTRLGFTPTLIGLLFSSMGVFQVIFRKFFFTGLRDRLGDVKTALLGLLNFAPAYLLLSLVGGFVDMMLVLFYISFCTACSRGIVTGLTSRTVDFRNQGKIMGVTTSVDNLCQIAGPILGSLLLALPTVFAYTGVLAGCAFVALALGTRLFQFGFDNDNEDNRPSRAPPGAVEPTPKIG